MVDAEELRGYFAGLGQLGAALGKGIKCASTLGKFVKGTAAVTKVMSTAMGGFDTVALLDKAFGNGKIAELNSKLHQSKAYNIFQTGITAVSVFTGGMTTTMKCFVAGTLVLTANGLIAIEAIKAGDMVYAADADTLEVSLKPVLETYIRETSKLVHITVNGEEIVSTYDHPYYVKGKGFVSAEALWIGAKLVDNNGQTLTVEQIYREILDDVGVKVYNFKVQDNHTYYVGETGILVHNAAKYIEDNRVPMDKETVLTDKSKFKRTNARHDKATVYKGKDGNYYYRDTLHTGKRAHLEVFNKQGIHLGEANPLSGDLILGTADPSKYFKIK